MKLLYDTTSTEKHPNGYLMFVAPSVFEEFIETETVLKLELPRDVNLLIYKGLLSQGQEVQREFLRDAGMVQRPVTPV